MSRPRVRFVAGLASVALLCLSGAAGAIPCGRPDVDLTFPPNESVNVPANAQLAAHYAAPALYDDEAVSLLDPDGKELPAVVSYDDAESMMRLSPTAPLGAGLHKVVWPGLRSVSSGGVGRGSTVSFVVDNAIDAAPPRFAGLSHINWDLSRDRDPCLDRLEDRFVFELELGETDDDSGRELLSVLVFQTVDPMAPEQTEPSKVALRAVSSKLEVRRPANKAGKTCFAAVVQDLLGNVSGGGEVEVCAKTKRPPFFDGCAVRSAGAGSDWATATYLGACLALVLFRVRRGASAGSRSKRESN